MIIFLMKLVHIEFFYYSYYSCMYERSFCKLKLLKSYWHSIITQRNLMFWV
jgi:hypothetical protein